MNQLVQALYKGSNVGGHNISNESLENNRSPHSNVTSNGDAGEEIPVSEVYKRVQHGADIPIRGLQKPAPEKSTSFRHQTSDVIRKSLPSKEKEIDGATRRKRLEDLIEKARSKHIQEEAEKNASRKHHDFFTAAQKSPISPTRYEDVIVPSPQTSPQLHQSPTLQGYKQTTQNVSPGRQQWSQIQGKARALFNFTAQSPRELSFKKGDVLYLLRPVDKNWFLSEHYGQVGIIPASYIEILAPAETNHVADLNTLGLARAKFNFTGQSAGELSLKKGEFVTVLRRVDGNWLEGRTGGQQGIFPASYVNLIQEPSAPLITPSPSIITSPITGTPGMLSPMSWKTPTPPLLPSPSVFTNFSPETSDHHYSQSDMFTYGFQSSDEYPEFNVFDQKRITSSPITNEEFGFTWARSESSKPVFADALTDSEINFEHTPSASESVNRSWSHISDNDDDDLPLHRHRAVCSYKPQNEDELELNENDEVFVMGKCDDGWFMGTSERTGQFGMFPSNCVQKYC